MRLVNLDKKYLETILDAKEKYPNHGVGIILYFKEKYIFIPVTSQKIEFDEEKRNEKIKYLKIGKRNGTLLIQDYIYVHPQMIKDMEENQTIKSMIQILKNNKLEIEKRLRDQINFSKKRIDKEKIDLFEKFNEKIKQQNILKAKKYMDEAIKSMSIIEKINMNEEMIDCVIDYKCFENIDLFDVETIINIKNAWLKLKRTLDIPLTLDMIINFNEIIAVHQALKVGILRDGRSSVSGEFIFEEPIKKDEVLKTIEKIVNYKPLSEKSALDIFYYIILNQWFYDGNKRTAFIVANKILINSGRGILLIEEKNIEEFQVLLYSCYKKRGYETKEKFIKFLNEKCIKKFI